MHALKEGLPGTKEKFFYDKSLSLPLDGPFSLGCWLRAHVLAKFRGLAEVVSSTSSSFC